MDVLADRPPADSHVTAGGKPVETPAIGGLSCADMRAVLAEIAATGYRRDGLPRPGSTDWPLFAYEDALAGAHFHRCTARRALDGEGSDAFRRGFGAD